MVNVKNQLYSFWLIGKYVFQKQKDYENSFCAVSNFLSYYYGMSNTFTIFNIKMMRNFYCCFPIFICDMNRLHWEHYLQLVTIIDVEERYFYFRVAIFCRSNADELQSLIDRKIYNVI